METCYHCLTIRTKDQLFEIEPGVWLCRDTRECLAAWRKLPEWVR